MVRGIQAMSLTHRRFHSAVWTAALLLLLCPPATCQADAAKKLAAEQEIRETVVRKQMEDWYRKGDRWEEQARGTDGETTAKRMNFKVFFVSLNGKDPSDSFLKRLKDIPRTIKRASSAGKGKGPRTPVIDKATGQRGIIFSAGTVRWLSKDYVEVEGGYYCDGLCAAGTTFELRLENNNWVVKRAIGRWIS